MIDSFIQEIQSGKRPAFACVLNNETWQQAEDIADTLSKFEHILWLGMGGSTLGAQTLTGVLTPENNRIIYLDNSDSHTLERTLKTVNLSKCAVVCVSKSGGTIETLATACLILERMERDGINADGRFVCLTEDKPSALMAFTAHTQGRHIPHDPLVGGRFSIFSIVGLLALALSGGDGKALLQNARTCLQNFMESPKAHPAYQDMQKMHAQNLTGHILMPYGDRFKIIGEWFVQLWAESLGKDGKGPWPSVARGASDQHACLQMMMDGPNTNHITILREDTRGSTSQLTGPWADTLQSPLLKALNLGDLLYYQAEGTYDALKNAGRPVRLWDMEHLGRTLMTLMLETVSMADILQIDPWEQDAVEDSKKRTATYLG